ncbi:MAG: protein kinase [Pirellulaceae bacterium]|nr:protein kinase [Pirellulaceae bacterium]
MNNQAGDAGINIFEQISQICREFRKLLVDGQTPRIEIYLARIMENGRETLFSNLLEVEVNFRQRKSERLDSDEYVRRFPQYAKQIRRAFFEPTMGSMDSSDSTDGETRAVKNAASPMDTPTFDSPAANRLGDYELVRELGRGGMGVVYEARHTKTGNRVALKTLPTGHDGQELNADRLHRFRKEFRSLSEINHPNLVGMQSLEVDGAQWFFTMDLIEGEDFLSFVRPQDVLDESRLRDALKQLARGIMALHQRRIIHRDLKPSNVLVERHGRVAILDFGLVAEMQKVTDVTQTRSAMFAGTPRYAAPEQMLGQRSEASDWYALGVMLYESLTGELPFAAKNPMELLRLKHEQNPPSLSGRADLPSDMAELVDGLLKRVPTERLSSAVIGARLQLADETRAHSSTGTAGSTGSSGSMADEDEPNFLEPQEEEIVLIGRETQLAQLEEARQEMLRTRQPVVVWVTGLSGEGKSSLVEKFLGPLRRGTEMLVLSGRCYDRESVPFKVIDSFIEPLVRFLRSQKAAILEQLLPPDIEMLAQLFPVLGRVPPIANRRGRKISGLDDKQLRNLAFAALRDLMTNIARTTPLVIHVDDLQWGDADSAAVMVSLLNPPNAPSALLLGSFRSDEMDDSPFLREWNQRISGRHEWMATRNIMVEPLTEAQCLKFLHQRFAAIGEAVNQGANELFKNTRGNPYFLEQLIEGFDADSGSFKSIPLAQVVENRLRNCPQGARELLEVIAIAGKAVSVSEVSTVAGHRSPAIAAITHMRSERLVRLIGSKVDQLVDTYHDKIREAVLAGMETTAREQWHRQFADVIEESCLPPLTGRPADREQATAARVFDLAHHCFASNDPRAFGYQLRAGEISLGAGAMEAALDHLQKAGERKPESIDKATEFRLRFLTAKAKANCHQYSEANADFNSALEFATTRLNRAKCHQQLSEIHWKRSEYAESQRCLCLGFEEFGIRLPQTLFQKLCAGFSSMVTFHFVPARLYFKLKNFSPEELDLLSRMYGNLHTTLGQLDVSVFLLTNIRGAVVAKVSEDTTLKSIIYTQYASTLQFAGVPWFPRRLMRWANTYSAQLADLPDQASAYQGVYHYSRGELEAAMRAFVQAESGLIRSGDYLYWGCPHFLWHVWSIRGNASKVVHYSRREHKVALASGDRIVLAYSEYGQAEGFARQGRTDEALVLANSALETLDSLKAFALCIAQVQLARVLLQIGEYENARRHLGKAIRMYLRLVFNELTFPALPLYVDASVSPNWCKRTQQVIRSSIPLRVRLCAQVARILCGLFPNHRPATYRASGRLAVAKGKTRKAIKYFDKAIAAAEKIGAEYELARSLIDKSMLDHPQATADRQCGLDLLESLGCVLPDAEVEYLGLDRAAHHARAAEARVRHEAELEAGK